MNREKPDTVEVHGPHGKLPKLPVLAEDLQAPHILKECAFPVSPALGHFQSLLVGKLEKLKNGQPPLFSRYRGVRHKRVEILGALEQVSGEQAPDARAVADAIEVLLQQRQAAFPLLGEGLGFPSQHEGAGKGDMVFARKGEQRLHIDKRDLVFGKVGHPDEAALIATCAERSASRSRIQHARTSLPGTGPVPRLLPNGRRYERELRASDRGLLGHGTGCRTPCAGPPPGRSPPLLAAASSATNRTTFPSLSGRSTTQEVKAVPPATVVCIRGASAVKTPTIAGCVVIAPERPRLGARKVIGEQAHIVWSSAAKAVDCLPDIADDPQPLAGICYFAQEQSARAIYVLVLIDQHMGIGLADGCSDGRVRPQQVH